MQTLINGIFDLFKILLILEVVRFICFKLFTRNPILRFFFTKFSGNRFYFKKRIKQYRRSIKRFKKLFNKLVVKDNKDKHQKKTTHKKVVNDSNVIYYKKNSKLRHKWNK